MSTRRLFLGLEVPRPWSRALAAHARSTLPRAAGLTLYPARDLHLTLVFLGNFPEDRRAALESTLAWRVCGAPVPELVPGGTGAFPHRRRPRILWAGVGESRPGAEDLEGLRERVWSAAMDHGWRPTRAERERPFRPHVTLARVGRVGRVEPDAGLARFYVDGVQELAGDETDLESWSVGQVAVFESRPDRPRERYPVLARAPL